MREYFEEQLKSAPVITQEKLDKLQGKGYYDEYKVGDVMLWFLEQEIGEIIPPHTDPEINLTMRTVTKRNLKKLEQDFQPVKDRPVNSSMFPVLERKNG